MTHDPPNLTHALLIVTVVSVGLDATAPLNAWSPMSVTQKRPAASTHADRLWRSTTTRTRAHAATTTLASPRMQTQPQGGLRDNHHNTSEHSGDIGA